MAASAALAAGDRQSPLLEVSHVVKSVRGRRGPLRILDDVSLSVWQGQSIGVVGESGCGKSTLAEILVGLQAPSEGSVAFRGVVLSGADRSTRRQSQGDMRIVFQDPYASLDPRLSALEIVGEPLRNLGRLSKSERRLRAAELLVAVGLLPQYHGRLRPGELSGGQAQRVAIARALATDPSLLILDEAVSSLDVSVRAQILNLLRSLADDRGLTYVFIAHDLDAVRYVSETVLVMYLGRVCEVIPSRSIGRTRMHPYTDRLFGSDRSALWERGDLSAHSDAGEPPSIFNRPSGCPYRTRCPEASAVCEAETPALRPSSGGAYVACHKRGDQL